MARRGWAILLAVVLLTGCLRPDVGIPAAPAATLPPVVILPTVTPTPVSNVPTGPVAAATGITYTSPRYGYTLTLPPGWRAMMVPPAQLDAALARTDRDELAPLAPSSLAEGGGQTLELIALLTDEAGAPPAQLTVMVLPRGTLSLPAYLDQTAELLAQVATTRIERAELDPTLRGDGLPVAVIEYTADLDEPLAGYQATLIGGNPSTLVVLTFTTRIDAYIGLRPQFVRVVSAVDPASPSTPGG